MPPFPERESSILAKLKKKKGPGNLPDIDDVRRNVNGTEHNENTEEAKKVAKFDRLQITQTKFFDFLPFPQNPHPSAYTHFSSLPLTAFSAKLPPLI